MTICSDICTFLTVSQLLSHLAIYRETKHTRDLSMEEMGLQRRRITIYQ